MLSFLSRRPVRAAILTLLILGMLDFGNELLAIPYKYRIG